MTEEAIFIQRRISHYGAMLKPELNDEHRAKLDRLLRKDVRKLMSSADDEQNIDASS